jgi:hypothetical protein
MRRDRLRLQVEQIVENADQLLPGQTIGHLREAAQVRRPQHGGDRFAAAPPDLTGQHLPPALRAKIGFQDIFRDLSLAVHVGDDRQSLRHRREVCDLPLREPIRPVGDIGRHIGARPKGAADRKRKIIGRAARLQIVQDGKVQTRFRPLQPAPQDFAARDPHHRILLRGNQVGDLMGDHDLLGLRAGAPPDIEGAEELRMQRAATQADPQHGYPRRHQSPRQFVDRPRERTGLPGATDQPLHDLLDRVMTGPLRNRAFDHFRDDDIAALHDQRGRFDFAQTLAPRNFCSLRQSILMHEVSSLFADRPRYLADNVAGMFCGCRFKKHDEGFFRCERQVLNAAGHHINVSRSQNHLTTVAIAQTESALVDHEQLVLVGMAVPDEFAFHARNLQILPVCNGNDAGRPMLGHSRIFGIKVDNWRHLELLR